MGVIDGAQDRAGPGGSCPVQLQPDGSASLGLTGEAMTVSMAGRPVLVIPRDRFPDLIVRLAAALREAPLKGSAGVTAAP